MIFKDSTENVFLYSEPSLISSRNKRPWWTPVVYSLFHWLSNKCSTQVPRCVLVLTFWTIGNIYQNLNQLENYNYSIPCIIYILVDCWVFIDVTVNSISSCVLFFCEITVHLIVKRYHLKIDILFLNIISNSLCL